MEREIAERFAATTVEGLTLKNTRAVIQAFVTELARCATCDGSGVITFGRDVQIEGAENHHPAGDLRILAGTRGSCPRCGSLDRAESGKGDPEFVAWHCTKGDAAFGCRRDRADEHKLERRNEHVKCGWRVLLPYETTDEGNHA